MTPPLPLAGKTIVVTRPRAQADALADGIRQAGGKAYVFPLLEILPCPDLIPLRKAANHLANVSFAIFISANAVRYAIPAIRDIWPEQLVAVAPGAGTAKALADAGITRCIMPKERFDSEGLLALPEFAADKVAGREIIIFKGEGGRELLADTLKERGAKVFSAPVYRRNATQEGQEEFFTRLAARQFNAMTLSSSEALRHLLEQAAVRPNILHFLHALPLFTTHPRIVEQAETAGFTRVICTDTDDTGLLTGLCAYNWQS
ncbi:MAG: uroporphyrinogen-III synthase [Zoogloeaceae bacterium]|jgi:uroporphyrinogen-III synthase|nr:uroporphyrinogen-III synthase [Zoogloeaceae bacterium]